METKFGSQGTPVSTIDKEPVNVVRDAIAGTDEEMGEENPSVPAAWVFGTYPIVLLIFAFVAILAYTLSGPENHDGSTTPSSGNSKTNDATTLE